MPRLYQTKIWQLQIPDAWSVRIDAGPKVRDLLRPDGVGLLRVLTAEEQSPVQKGKRDDFRGRLVGKTWTSTHATHSAALGHCRAWPATLGDVQVFSQNSDVECSEVDEILQSISEVA